MPARRSRRAALLAITLLLSLGVHAQPQWQLDIVVFERSLSPPVEYDPSWAFARPDWLPTAAPLLYSDQASAATAPVADGGRPPDSTRRASALAGAISRLDSSGAYRVLSTASWRLPKKQRSETLALHAGSPMRLVAREALWGGSSAIDYWLSAPDLAPPVEIHGLEAVVNFSHDVVPIVALDISYVLPLVGMEPRQIDPDGRLEYFRDQVQQFPMHGQRSLKPGQPAYFDHFRLGVLAQLSEVPEAEPLSPDSAPR